MTKLFITSPGTELGKTHVTAALVRVLRAKGRTVEATKPAQSGIPPEDLDISDAGVLLKALGRPVTPETVAEICPHTFPAALAPNMAARAEGASLDYGDMLTFCETRLSLPTDIHFVEGAGGVMAPMTDDTLNIDVIADLNCEAVLVCGAYLGAISHTLTAIEVLKARSVPLRAAIINEQSPSPVGLDPTLGELRRFAPDVTFLAAPHGFSDDDAANLCDGLGL